MAERVIEAEVVKERIVDCPRCRRRNRLHDHGVTGVYKCGACRTALPNPFASSKRVLSTRLMGIVGASLIALLVIIALIKGLSFAPQQQPSTRDEDLAAPLELTPPATGSVLPFTTQEGIAPFEIRSSLGTNYLLKVVDASSGQPVLTTYIHGGDTVNIGVPLGTYVVKYAYGDKWYGYDYLFGPKTGYTKASEFFTFDETDTRIRGHTMTLYKVPYGNLRTERIKPNEF